MVRKERDELKAKLYTHAACFDCDFKKKLAAAERCIDECAKHVESSNDALCSFVEIGSVIRAYREKEAK